MDASAGSANSRRQQVCYILLVLCLFIVLYCLLTRVCKFTPRDYWQTSVLTTILGSYECKRTGLLQRYRCTYTHYELVYVVSYEDKEEHCLNSHKVAHMPPLVSCSILMGKVHSVVLYSWVRFIPFWFVLQNWWQLLMIIHKA